MEEHIQLDPPTHDEMLELFSFFLSNIPIGGDDHERSALIEDLSVRCAGKTPSDIKQIVTEACMLSARQGITEYEEQKKNSVDFVSGFRSCSLSQLHFKLLAGINESAVRTLNTAF